MSAEESEYTRKAVCMHETWRGTVEKDLKKTSECSSANGTTCLTDLTKRNVH